MDLMTYALCKGNGGGSGGDNRFIVTCTPTSASGGTMDKTIAEIYDAYDAGKQIVFRAVLSGSYYESPMFMLGKSENYTYSGVQALLIDSNALLQMYTSPTNDGTLQTFAIIYYALTPVN